jgi:hypothetical protein
MMNNSAISSNPKAFDKTIPFLFKQKFGEDFKSQNKEKMRRGSPRLNPLSEEKKPKGLPLSRMEKEEEEMQTRIQESQIGLKPSFSIIDKSPLHSIKSLLYIHLEKHTTTFASLRFESMKKLIGQNCVVLNIPLGNKSRLKRRNDLWKKDFQSVGRPGF